MPWRLSLLTSVVVVACAICAPAKAQSADAVYSNLGTFQNQSFAAGGATLQVVNTITRMAADDLNLVGTPPYSINGFRFTVTNRNAVEVTARPLVRFYLPDGPGGGPGTLIEARTYNPIAFAPLSVGKVIKTSSTFVLNVSSIWAGITFDNNGGTTGATAAQLDNLAQGIFSPPELGTSADRYFVTTDAGSFASDNPVGTLTNFGGAPPADFGWEILTAQDVNLSITNSDGVDTAFRGGSVVYTITASNAGPQGAFGARVVDLFPASLTCSWTCSGSTGNTCAASGTGDINDATVDLAASGSVIYTATCAVSPAATGTLVNTAAVFAPDTAVEAGATDNLATDTDTIGISADLAITKTDGVTSATAGGSVTYTITASNAGPDDATGATVVDTFPAALTCTWTCLGAGGGTCTAAGSGNVNDTVNLPAGGSVTYTASCTIAAAATGTLSNTATVTAPGGVTDPNPGNNSATDTDTLTPQADLAITKTDGVTTASPGGSVTYTITANNAGPSNTTGATVVDTFPVALTCTWTCLGAGGGTCTAAGSGNLNDTVNLPAGGSVTYTASCAIAAAATGTLSNTATVTAPGGVTDPNPGNNSATDTDTLTPPSAPAINIVKFVNGQDANSPPGPHVAAGSTVTFTYVVTNTGNVPLANVVVTDDKLGPITSFTGDTNGNGRLDLTETWTYTKTATAVAGQQTNVGTATAQDANSPPGTTVTANNPANYFGDSSAIHIVKFVNGQDANSPPGPHVAAGSTVTFTYVVTNTGNVPLANVVVTDDKLGPITSFTGDTNGNGRLDLTETWTYTKTATAVAGQQTNVGTVTGQDTTTATTVSNANPANYFGDVPAIHIVKFVNGQDADSPPGPHVAAGSTVTFTYVVTNTGNVPLANVVVTDDKLGPITSFTGDTNGNGRLDLTETWTYTKTATAVAGQQTNVGIATAQDANSPPGTTVTANNPANYFGDASGLAGLAITKTDGVTTATPGGSVTYNITASNAGPGNATGATVADTFPASLTCTWTCAGAGGGICTAAGNGNLNDTVNLPAGGSVTYTASCTIAAAATGTLSNTATVTAPAGVTDPNPANNSSTDTDTLALAPIVTFSGPSATGTGTITASFPPVGGCSFTAPQYIGPPPGAPPIPPTVPNGGATFPHGLFKFSVTGCPVGATVVITMTYPQPLPNGTSYYKYGPTLGDPAPHWYIMPAAIAGNTATLTITDGGLGDDDRAANGTIVDQGGPGVPPTGAGEAVQIPTLSRWAMLLLALLLLGFAAPALRRRS